MLLSIEVSCISCVSQPDLPAAALLGNTQVPQHSTRARRAFPQLSPLPGLPLTGARVGLALTLALLQMGSGHVAALVRQRTPREGFHPLSQDRDRGDSESSQVCKRLCTHVCECASVHLPPLESWVKEREQIFGDLDGQAGRMGPPPWGQCRRRCALLWPLAAGPFHT